MNKYLIIPDCSDHNRGDQALIWETIRLVRDAGFRGDYYMQYAGTDCSQSIAEGIKLFNPILPHPSHGTKENNVSYNTLMLKWGLRAVFDLIRSLWIILVCKSRLLCSLFLTEKTNQTLALFRDSSAVFVKGGGFIHSFGGVTAFYFIYYHLYTINLAHRIGVPVFIMPNSFGPIEGFLCKWQVRNALKKCKLIYCRENVSYDYMTKHFKGIHFIESFDLGIYLERDKGDGIRYKPEIKNKVAITVRPYRFPEHSNGGQLYSNYIAVMHRFTLWLMAKGFFPVFVQHTLAQNAHEDDMQAINDITEGLKLGEFDVFSDASLNCRQMKSLYSNFDYIVGTRFHSVIFSLMEGVPAVAIAYGGNKTRGIMRDMDLSEYVIGIDVIELVRLQVLFEKLVEDSATVKEKLDKFKITASQERREIVKSLMSYCR